MNRNISPRFLALLREEKPAGRRVLDLGCGGGRLTFALAAWAGGSSASIATRR
jgi:predicted RNA methylase